MREILFRGKRKDNGEWAEGLTLQWGGDVDPQHEKHVFLTPGGYSFPIEIESDTVCQYTGLKDRNGRKIFEGDIVKCGGSLVVGWNDKLAGWCLTRKGWAYSHFFGEACSPEDCEITGNIFDNAEIL